MEKIKKWLLYSGISREQLRLILPEVQRRNIKNLYIYSLGMSVYFIAFLIYAIVATGFNAIYYLYMADAVIMTIFFFVVRYFYKKKIVSKWVPAFLTYVFIAIIYADAIMITCLFPNRQSSAFFVRLVLMPVVCMDMPLRMMCFQVLSVVLFSIITPFYNLPEVVALDESELVSYIIISFIICIFISSIHTREILHELNSEYLSNYDVLTGVKNRNSFENEHIPENIKKQPINYYIYADVNGLHELNNAHGHEAGDTMLKTVAGGLSSIFGADCSYRIGGDEFISFTDRMSREQIDKEIKQLCLELGKKDYYVSFGIAGSDEDFSSRQDIIKAAEQRMYEAKKRYYEKKGIEFGLRNRKFD